MTMSPQRPADLERAAARLRAAKAQWTDAALASQRRDANAPALADAAMVELGDAREALRAIDNEGKVKC